ncbi:MAG TPA: hypothetical protein VGK87_17340 [Anaerolineae bacterium]
MFVDTNVIELELASLEMGKARFTLVRADTQTWQHEHAHRQSAIEPLPDILWTVRQTLAAFTHHHFEQVSTTHA